MCSVREAIERKQPGNRLHLYLQFDNYKLDDECRITVHIQHMNCSLK